MWSANPCRYHTYLLSPLCNSIKVWKAFLNVFAQVAWNAHWVNTCLFFLAKAALSYARNSCCCCCPYSKLIARQTARLTSSCMRKRSTRLEAAPHAVVHTAGLSLLHLSYYMVSQSLKAMKDTISCSGCEQAYPLFIDARKAILARLFRMGGISRRQKSGWIAILQKIK